MTLSSNLERWQFFMKDQPSPDAFIESGFYFMISSALQRRVWVGSPEQPLFPNTYFVLVGGPAVGKGLVITQVNRMMRYFGIDSQNSVIKLDDIKNDFLTATGGANLTPESTLLFPMAPSSVTFEALVQCLNQTLLAIRPTANAAPYVYKCLAFCLEELSSLMKHNTNKVCDFLLCAFDCGDYDNVTKNAGSDKIRKMCLSILAGTTPVFMQEAFTSRLLADGFSSRTIFVFEIAPRFHRFQISAFSEEQKSARNAILVHMHKLSRLYGQVSYTPAAFECLRGYVEDVLPMARENPNPKLDSYYGRKNVHLQKLAMAIHFADHTSMVVDLPSVEKALDFLARVEKRMHMALSFGRNPLESISQGILKFIKVKRKVSVPELLEFASADLREIEIDEVLRLLISTAKVSKSTETTPEGKVIQYYEPI